MPQSDASSSYSAADPLKLRFLGALVEELGRRQYPSATATLAELISNAWDADAENVWVEMPLGKEWTKESRIIVTDDGNGMTRQEAAKRYLEVGRKRRQGGKDTSDVKGRKLHGRKGVGKLGAFGTADTVTLVTKTIELGALTAFSMNYDRVRKAPPGEDVAVDEIANSDPPTDPEGGELEHGTRVQLSDIRLKKVLDPDQFVASMQRHFAITASEMKVFINGSELARFDVDTRFRFPGDAAPEDVAVDDGWGVEVIDGKEVRWWIGFTPLPIAAEDLRGVAVIVRGKMAQRPFMFQGGGGVTSQLGQEYLVGEVVADWIDDDPDVEGDLIATNRSELMFEDERLQGFLDWGRKRLRWALRKRQKLIEEANVEKLELSDDVKKRLQDFTSAEQKVFKGVGASLAKLPESKPDDIEALMLQILDGQSDKAIRAMLEQINELDPEQQTAIWQLVSQFSLIDARRSHTMIQARLAVIAKLRALVEGGGTEVPEIHDHIKESYWLIDPRWQLMDDEVYLDKLLHEKFGIEDVDEDGLRVDFVYCLAPRQPTPPDEVFLVEIKRGTTADGKPRRVTPDEVHRFQEYFVTLDAYLKKTNTNAPRLRGVMIATDYTAQAALIKADLERNPDVEFKSWQSVIGQTEALHTGWLELSSDRTSAGDEESPKTPLSPST